MSPPLSAVTVYEIFKGLSPLKSTVPIVSPSAVKIMLPPLMRFPLSSVKLAVNSTVSPNSAVKVLLDKNVRIEFTLPLSR